MTTEKQSYAMLQPLSAFMMLAGPGAAVAFYTALVGFYSEKFQSRSFFVFMMACLYAPAPVICLMQERLDALFDRWFSTTVTFFFRVVVMQITLAIVVLAWMFLTQSPTVVLSIGFLIGTVYGAVASSSLQMVAAMEPEYVVYAQIGQQIGAVLPVVMFFVSNFHPSASLHEFRMVVFPVVLICAIALVMLSYFHFALGMFEKTYQRLAYDQEGDDPFQRQLTETVPIMSPGDGQAVPAWVWRWSTCVGAMTAMEYCLVSLCGFFGDVDLAQFLSLGKLTVDCLGRFLALPVPKVSGFRKGPGHKILCALVLVFSIATILVFAKLVGFGIWMTAFLAAWFAFHTINQFTGSFVDVTTGSYVSVKDRKSVSRTRFMVQVTGGFIGVAVAIAIVIIGGHFPAGFPKSAGATL